MALSTYDELKQSIADWLVRPEWLTDPELERNLE